MGSFSFSEIITILVVILIVFGPDRLPELARKTGKIIAQARRALASFTDQLESEYGDATQPLRELKDQYDGVRKDLTDAVTSIGSIDVAPTSGAKPPTGSDDAPGGDVGTDPEDEAPTNGDAGEVDGDGSDPGVVA